MGTSTTIFGSRPSYLAPSGTGSMVPFIFKPLDIIDGWLLFLLEKVRPNELLKVSGLRNLVEPCAC